MNTCNKLQLFSMISSVNTPGHLSLPPGHHIIPLGHPMTHLFVYFFIYTEYFLLNEMFNSLLEQQYVVIYYQKLYNYTVIFVSV